jgi:DNA-binding SARP family transcriptional activator
MDYRLLGPLEVLDGGQPLVLGGAKQRALLALLLLNANHVVPVDRIVDELWGDSPPGTAANAIQVYVANLRKLLQPGRVQGAASEVIVTRAPGYLMRVDENDVDLLRFERMTDEARQWLSTDPEKATARLRQALALWRGPALADIVFEASARGEITRLEELRVSALEDRIQGDLDLGRHAALVGELEALVVSYPVRERLHGQRMLALYRCGRQADALKAYREARRMLADELGIDPCAELQSLERAILQQDPALAAPPRTAPAPPPVAPAPVTADTDAAVTLRMEPAPLPAAVAPLVWQPAASPPAVQEPAPAQPEHPSAPPQERASAQQEQPALPAQALPPEPAALPERAAPAAVAATAEVAATEASTARAGGSRASARLRPRLLLAGAAILLLGSFGGVVLHSRSGGSASPGVSTPGASPSPTAITAAFPTAAEQQLMDLFPPQVDTTNSCHRYAKHYPKAIAEVECNPGPAHPGTKSIVYQQFRYYGDLEEHYHHVLALDIQREVGNSRPLTKANNLPCGLDPTFFALSTYPIGNEIQDVQSPYAHGHFFCYIGNNGVPKIAWTNVAWLIVAQAEGDGTGTAVQNELLASWQFDGPVGLFGPPANATTPEAQVRYLYDRYLQRGPDAPGLVDQEARIATLGFAASINGFTDSQEAKKKYVPDLLHH